MEVVWSEWSEWKWCELREKEAELNLQEGTTEDQDPLAVHLKQGGNITAVEAKRWKITAIFDSNSFSTTMLEFVLAANKNDKISTTLIIFGPVLPYGRRT